MNLQIGVKVILRNSSGELLFIKRAQRLENTADALWDIPGGRIEPHESLDEALRREIKEELGIELHGTPQLLNAQDIFVSSKDLHVVRLTYLLDSDIDIAVVQLSNEHQDVTWLLREEAIGMTEPFLSETLTTKIH